MAEINLNFVLSKAEADRDVFDKLEEVHLVTSCLKAYMTLAAAEGIEQCRRACGGHGYLQASGVSLHLVSYLPQVTYEVTKITNKMFITCKDAKHLKLSQAAATAESMVDSAEATSPLNDSKHLACVC